MKYTLSDYVIKRTYKWVWIRWPGNDAGWLGIPGHVVGVREVRSDRNPGDRFLCSAPISREIGEKRKSVLWWTGSTCSFTPDTCKKTILSLHGIIPSTLIGFPPCSFLLPFSPQLLTPPLGLWEHKSVEWSRSWRIPFKPNVWKKTRQIPSINNPYPQAWFSCYLPHNKTHWEPHGSRIPI